LAGLSSVLLTVLLNFRFIGPRVYACPCRAYAYSHFFQTQGESGNPQAGRPLAVHSGSEKRKSKHLKKLFDYDVAARSTRARQFNGVMPIFTRESRIAFLLRSRLPDVVKQCHEAIIHVELLMAMEQGQPRIVGYEVDFRLLIPAKHDHIFHDAAGSFSGKTRQLEEVPMKVDRMYVVTRIAHANAISLAFL
jgi:hypothetical protein